MCLFRYNHDLNGGCLILSVSIGACEQSSIPPSIRPAQNVKGVTSHDFSPESGNTKQEILNVFKILTKLPHPLLTLTFHQGYINSFNFETTIPLRTYPNGLRST